MGLDMHKRIIKPFVAVNQQCEKPCMTEHFCWKVKFGKKDIVISFISFTNVCLLESMHARKHFKKITKRTSWHFERENGKSNFQEILRKWTLIWPPCFTHNQVMMVDQNLSTTCLLLLCFVVGMIISLPESGMDFMKDLNRLLSSSAPPLQSSGNWNSFSNH